jgi:hypothetical protein
MQYARKLCPASPLHMSPRKSNERKGTGCTDIHGCALLVWDCLLSSSWERWPERCRPKCVRWAIKPDRPPQHQDNRP